MDIKVCPWDEISTDSPVEKLSRKLVQGERMLAARIILEPGCEVPIHQHENEQIACVLRGRILWRLGSPGTPEYEEREVLGGTFFVLPSNKPHGVLALEETEIIDILSPPGPMGVDTLRANANQDR